MARLVRFLLAAALVGVLLSPARAQDQKPSIKRLEDEYRQSFKKPETALEYWAAMRFEIGVGKYDLAAEDLKGFLAKNPTDEELLQIEQEQGISAFLDLLAVPQLRKDARPLLERVTALLKKRQGDPERIRRFIANLSASPEERAYAINELRRSGPLAVPFLIQALHGNRDATYHATILSAMFQLGADIVPPVLAALDMEDATVRVELIDLLRRRADKAAIPYLWYLGGSPRQPEQVRQAARETLLVLNEVKRPDQLPAPKVALTREAERYYRHQEPRLDPQSNTVWEWRQGRLVSQALTGTQAEEFYGLRFAGQALDLDPAYEPAQVVFLSLAFEKGFGRAGLDQPLEKGAPQVLLLGRVVSPELLMAVLDRALTDQRPAVILGAIRSLGDLHEVRAVRPTSQRQPALLRALNYPDRRVQLAAADALLGIPSATPYPSAARIVEVLRRAVIVSPAPRVVVADVNPARGDQVARLAREAGYEAERRATGREILERLAAAADIDAVVIVVDAGRHTLPQAMPPAKRPGTAQTVAPADPLLNALPYPGLPYFLAQLRADVDNGLLPIILMVAPDQTGRVPPEFEPSLKRLAERYRNVWIAPLALNANELKGLLAARIADATGAPLSEAERKDNAARAMVWLKRLATGELPGYDVRPAAQTIMDAIDSPDLAPLAIEAAAWLPGTAPQQKLAQLVLSNAQPKLRAAAAANLSLSLQMHGVALGKDQVKAIEDLYRTTDDPGLRGNLALLVGSLNPDPLVTGKRLERYRPSFAPPAKEK